MQKRVLVVGLGVSGRSAADFLLKQRVQVVGIDDRSINVNDSAITQLMAAGLEIQPDPALLDFKQFDQVVLSPGVPLTHPIVRTAQAMGIEVIGEIELACRALSQISRCNPCIGITGTNGKTTVTLLVAHVLNQSGLPARVLGNVGVPLTSQIMDLKPNEVAVIELSSYQLETMVTPILEAATILNITPDHLDRYGNMENYAKAKSLIQKVMKNDAPLYLSQQVMKEYAHLFNENQRRIYYPRPEQPLLNASQPHDSTIVESRELSRSSKAVVPAADSINIRLFGYDPACFIYSDKKHIIFNQKIEYILPNSYRGIISHDVENIIAAYALCRQFGVTPQQFDHALQTFTKPPHRLQFVRCLNNITFIDDSKGTNVDAVIRAVESLEGPILLIAGGVDKGWSYYSWLQPFKNRVKAMYVIGQAAEKMVQELSIALAVHRCGTLAEAINAAHAEAEPGDIVLLSPGCASFDMFRDYAHRGEEFQRVVSAL